MTDGPAITRIRPILTAPDGRNRLVVVKVETTEPGLYGVGCATFTQRPRAVAAAVEYLEPVLAGRPARRIGDAWQVMASNAYWRNGPVLGNAISGVDQALWDIAGKTAGLPVHDLLGGRVREAMPVYRHADGRDPAEVADRATAFIEEGVRYVRCQLSGYGGGAPRRVPEDGPPGAYFDPSAYARAVPRLFSHLREVLGEEVELLHDVHERLPPIDAIGLAKRLEEHALYFLEDPLPPEQSGWLARLREQTSIPIAMGELFNHPQEWLELTVSRSIDFLRCHVSQLGGITPARKAATVAEAFGVRTAWHGPGDTSPVGHAAQLHLELATPNAAVHEWPGFPDVMHEVFPGCPRVVDGDLVAAPGPGLGIDIDESLAARFPPDDAPTTWTTARLPDGTAVWP